MKQGIKGYAPDLEERHLLKALLDKDRNAAQAAACAWLDESDIRNLNEGHRRLMPFLSHRIESWNMEHEKLAALRQEYRRYWISTQRNHFQADRLVEVLAALQVPVILLKGAALGRTVYPVPALRPFTDIDLFVHPQDFLDVQRLLVTLGCTIAEESPHSTLLRSDNFPEIDLHRSPYHEAVSEDLVSPIFSRIVPLPHNCGKLYRLGNEDQLLHTLAHGLRANTVSPLRWLVDSALLLRASGLTFDWPLFYREVIRLDLVEAVVRALLLLGDLCECEIDPRTLEDLEMRRTAATRLWFVAEREWKGPSVVWGMARRNRNWLETLKRFINHYGAVATRDGTIHLTRRAFARALMIVTGNIRD